MIEYKELFEGEICRELFDSFIRRQEVGDCWRRENGVWVIKSDPFIDDWSESDYQNLVNELKSTLSSGGFAAGAFLDGRLKGFVSVSAAPLGSQGQYLDLTNIYVSSEMRRMGIGRELFNLARIWASCKKAEKLYISAHSAVESQAFYKSLGCVEASEYSPYHVSREPFDCQLELIL